MRRSLWASIVLTLTLTTSAQHPRTLVQVKPGMLVGGLTYQQGSPPRRGVSYSGQKTPAVGLAEYTLQVVINGIVISAIIDTGSSAAQVACKGVQAQPGFAIKTVDLTKFAPAVKMVTPVSSAACQAFCAIAYTAACSSKPAIAGACEYQSGYGDNSWVKARAYAGALTFPGSALPAVTTFYFGCAFQASTNPYFFTDTSSLFGMDWGLTSLWSQLITAKLVSDTLYMCMGNGGDGRSDQSGVIIFGSDNMVALPKNYTTEIVTVRLLNPYTNQYVDTYSSWMQLTGLSVGANPDKSYSGSASLMASGKNVLVYLIDSGTSDLLLTTNEYNAWNTAFFNAIDVARQVTQSDDDQIVTMNKYYTPAQLNALLPPIVFNFLGASGPVRFMPSQYMVWSSGSTYNVNVRDARSTTQGILGNAWMNGWLIQQTRSTLALKLTRVNSCNDIIY